MKQPRRCNVAKPLRDLLGNDDEVPFSIKDMLLGHGDSHEKRTRPVIRKDNECGKVCFPSQTSARAAKKHRLKKGANVNRFREYFCKLCHAWHISSLIE